MRFSRNWIADYTDLPDGRVLHEAMSMLGLVVDDARDAGDDVILDLDFPSNRPDAMNHWGIARELAVAQQSELRIPAADFPATGPPSSDLTTVRLDDAACIRFVARVAIDVTVAPSPDWLRARLEAIDLRPINNVVDITNFVMWELGRPMHAYDLDKLSGGGLTVRRAAPGEKLITLDDIDRKLGPDDLVIADNARVVGLAGVMGGSDTGVTESTTRVLLECAYFDAVTVRRMAKRHGMHTDASHRFERGLSVEGIDAALDRACSILHETAGATISAAALDVTGEAPDREQVELRTTRLAGTLGVAIDAAEIERILSGLGFEALPSDGGHRVTVPARRVDVTREVDLIEEIARFHGYDNLPNTLPLVRRSHGGGLQPVLTDEAALRASAVGMGYWEAITFVFSSRAEQRGFAASGMDFVDLSNPLSEAFAVMRRHLAPGLLAAAARNHNVGESRIRLFEVGRAFSPGDATNSVVERRRLALLATGSVDPAHWTAPARAVSFSDIKGDVESLWHRMRWPGLTWSAADRDGLQAGAAATITCGDTPVGFAGKVDADLAAAAGVATPVWVAEIEIQDFAGGAAAAVHFADLERFPAAERDVSLVVSDAAVFASADAAIAAATDLPLESCRLLERYQGDDLPPGTTGWTLRLTYRSSERTLTAEEIESAHDAAVALLLHALDAKRR
jgi:phenylalanyl-tRNA synthetase beta chain